MFEISKMKDQYDGYCLTDYIRSVGLCHHKCVAGHGSNEGLTTTKNKEKWGRKDRPENKMVENICTMCLSSY